MNRNYWLGFSLVAFVVGAHLAHGLTVKPNVGPVINSAIPAYQQYVGTAGLFDLSPYFRDPDASAAARLTTPLGTMNFTLDGETTPITVANFLNYVNSGRYFKTDPVNGQLASTFFHRSVAGFVIQGGGFLSTLNPNNTGVVQPTQVTPYPAIQNEPFISNTRGTIAMAKLGNDPNSATSQWFVNLADNSANLDAQNGGFTVFGHVGGNGMTVADAIAALPKVNAGSPFDTLPVRNYVSPNPIKPENLVTIPEFKQIPPFVFTATSDNQSVVTVSTSGTNLLLRAQQVGTANITVTATDLDGASVSQTFAASIITAPGHILNISTRANFPIGNEKLTAGFFVKGGPSTRLIVRAVSSTARVENPLRDMALELFNAQGQVIASNDNWGDSPDAQLLTDLQIAPENPLEAAIIVNLPASATDFISYTATVRSVDGRPGRGLVEVFSLDSSPGSTLQNISTVGPVGIDADVLIGGFIINGTDPRRVVVRGVGPSLARRNVQGVLADPRIELYNSQNQIIDSNDDWQKNSGAAEIDRYGLAPEDLPEAALIITLPAGAYTAKVIGVGGTTGVGQVEVYQVQ